MITLSCEFLYGFYFSYFPQNTNYLPNLDMCPAIPMDYKSPRAGPGFKLASVYIIYWIPSRQVFNQCLWMMRKRDSKYREGEWEVLWTSNIIFLVQYVFIGTDYVNLNTNSRQGGKLDRNEKAGGLFRLICRYLFDPCIDILLGSVSQRVH